MGSNDFYKEHPKTCAPDDFWGQVKRTVGGRPVPQEQIDLIVSAVVQGLRLSSSDTLLDLCCGNGALSCLLFRQCAAGLGVDHSAYLIDVAQNNFAYPGHEYLLVDDVTGYVNREPDPERFNKAVCYGSFQYLDSDAATKLLHHLRDRFRRVEHLFIGNVPDKEQIARFNQGDAFTPGAAEDNTSPIGIWRNRDEFAALAASTGWRASFSVMPESFYASAYRYDVLLTPAVG
ncbi:MAG: methyltransferase domain-containing protein [Nitrospinae bacterium]|nr:methyltransferase domain-containing protein [Nitrospinota bacterium]